jgi:methylglyoxal synthase
VANDLAARLDGGSHDNKKRDMLEWAEYNLDLLRTHELFATATTGRLLRDHLGLPITCFRSGPFGGDQQIGADEVAAALQAHLIEEHGADPERAAPHSPSTNALKLLRQARERLGTGLRAVQADDIAESDEISLRNH